MSWLINFLTSGFGTGTDAGKALGWTILICLGVFILAWWVIAGIIKIVKYFMKKKKNDTPAAE